MIDTLRDVLTVAARDLNWESFGLWVAFVLSFPVAIWVISVPRSIMNGVSDSNTESSIFGLGILAIVFIGLPAFGVLLAAAWNAVDVLPESWNKENSFTKETWLLAKAIVGNWMRLVYCALPIPLVLLPFQLLCMAPAIKATIDAEKEEAMRAKEAPPHADVRLIVRADNASPKTTANTERTQPRQGLIPDPPAGEKLPEGWTYRPETPGGH